MARPILQLDGVTLHTMEGYTVLEDATWELARGAKLRVKGPSSHGTTAFLRLCAGLIHPQSGQVHLEGEPLSPYRFSHPFLDRGGLAWVPQDGGLLVNQTLLVNVALPLRFVRGLSKVEAEKRALEWLERVGLSSLAQRRPHAMPPQERWMGALARSAASGAELWLVDPPQGGLSPALRQKTQELLDSVTGDPTITVLLVEDGPWLTDPPRDWIQLAEGSLSTGSTP